jgi:iron-sulfur cluster repair protein YtfE (RIC family)
VTQNGIDFLLGQHAQVTALLDAVDAAPAAERQQSFDQLRELLAVHETAEELVLRPITRREVPGGEAIAAARMGEENQSKDALAELEKMDAGSAEFQARFADFASDVRQHAHNEETYEFPLVREQQTASELVKLGEQLETAEKLAPTHPHPSARSTAANIVLGPFAAMVDRVRDALESH